MRYLMLLFLLACDSAAPSVDDSADSGSTTAPKMTQADCSLDGIEFTAYAGSDLPPAAVIYVGVDVEGVPVWRQADAVAYRDGAFRVSAGSYTRCIAYIQ